MRERWLRVNRRTGMWSAGCKGARGFRKMVAQGIANHAEGLRENGAQAFLGGVRELVYELLALLMQ